MPAAAPQDPQQGALSATVALQDLGAAQRTDKPRRNARDKTTTLRNLNEACDTSLSVTCIPVFDIALRFAVAAICPLLPLDSVVLRWTPEAAELRPVATHHPSRGPVSSFQSPVSRSTVAPELLLRLRLVHDSQPCSRYARTGPRILWFRSLFSANRQWRDSDSRAQLIAPSPRNKRGRGQVSKRPHQELPHPDARGPQAQPGPNLPPDARGRPKRPARTSRLGMRMETGLPTPILLSLRLPLSSTIWTTRRPHPG